ncbi:Flp pilus assembly protein CpaB [Pseudohalocynthiibacter aestuariivivens]|uniref:Flp pilus assembly protein CpaB n=1 Tax=Roseovarius pelagicus TaxID=2980108 RepID=A0ABY6D8S7_9RHOB|nr:MULTISPECIES: Flp pilus assembly protein CpaB [Rhodobacterales]QIE45603.1 Flp pilus assembly protein CpaB [Pseudohalocynthiibacter aestuariivivens]UXX82478.1 Flp pilus assembly protein CpaB [Roseovarius pelagicus]
MRAVFGLVLVVGLGLAGFAVYMAKNYIQGYQAQLAQERKSRAPVIETVDIYVAKEPLKYGQRLMKKDVQLVKFPKASLPEGIYGTEEALFPEGEDEPRTVLRAMEKFEAILAVKVTGPGEDAGITNALERGMRAFAIEVDRTSGVSGFLRPGDRVDVYWTGSIGGDAMRTEGNSSGDVTKLIEAGIKLIAIDQSANGDDLKAQIARTVTVSARPEQVAALQQAQSTGRLSLSLVGAQDDTITTAIEIDQHQLLGLASSPVAVERPQEQVCSIRTRRGSEVIITPIPCTN